MSCSTFFFQLLVSLEPMLSDSLLMFMLHCIFNIQVKCLKRIININNSYAYSLYRRFTWLACLLYH